MKEIEKQTSFRHQSPAMDKDRQCLGVLQGALGLPCGSCFACGKGHCCVEPQLCTMTGLWGVNEIIESQNGLI